MSKAPLVPAALALMAGILLSHELPAVPMAVWVSMLSVTGLATGLLLLFGRSADRNEPALYPHSNRTLPEAGPQHHRNTTATEPQHDRNKSATRPQQHRKKASEQHRLWLLVMILASVLALGGAVGVKSHSKRVVGGGRSGGEMLVLKIQETPYLKGKTLRAKAEVEQVEGQEGGGVLRLYLRPDSIGRTLAYGDRILVHGYPDFERGQLYATGDHYVVVSHDPRSLRARAERLRLRLLKRMREGPLDARHAGVAEALTLGWKADIEEDTQANYRDAGIAHLLCVSGLHVGLLAMMAGWLTKLAGRERRGRIVRGVVQLTAVWGFSLLSGLAPSTLRAALMFSFFIVADISVRRTSRLNLLAAAAIVTLVCNPLLLFDVGWQLSYSAVAGILLAMPVVRLFRTKLGQGTVVSVAAQLATLPVVLTVFRRFPTYFLIANIVLIPLSAVVMGTALLYLALPCGFTAWPLELVLTFFDGLTGWVASLPGAVVGTSGACHV